MLLGAILMLVLSLALSWIPLVGPLIAGAVGGYYTGSAGKAFLAAIIPAMVLGIFVWWMGEALDHAIAGMLFAVATVVLVLVHEIGLVFGAVVGGFVASRKHAASGPRPA